MFNSIWRRFTQWRSHKTPIQRQPERTRLGVEILEDRVTPSLTASISATGILTVTSANQADSLTVTNSGFELFTITDNSGFTFTGGSGTFSNTAAQPILAMVFNLNGGGANTSLDLAGTAAAPINLFGPATINNMSHTASPAMGTDLTINATGANENITATNLNLLRSPAGLSMTLNGAESASFTDTNITGSAIINHTGTGNTNFDVQTSAANPTALNTWGSLAITNGAGADSQIISDTDFTGSVTINNGLGSGTGGVIYPDEGQDSGSQTWLFGENDHQMLTIGGNLAINTTTGQSDAEINNYNVLGAFNVNGGAGITGQQFGSVVAIDNCPVFPGGPVVAGVPVFGSINITGGSVLTGTGVNAGFNVFLGTGVGSGFGPFGPIPTDNTPPVYLAPDFPIMVTGNLSVSATGTGSVNMYLDDLTVGGAATLTTSATNNNGVNIVVLGDQAATSFGSLSVNVLSDATGVHAAANNVYLQAQQGTMNVNGALNVNLGSGNDTVTVGSAVPGSNVSVGGIFGLTGTGGNKSITVVGNVGNPADTNNKTFGGLNWTLKGNGAETASFTDTNITGSAIINHTGTGNTNFDVQTSAANSAALNTWGSLAITNGIGADSQIISDTDFTGSVTINNGPGSGTGGVIYPDEGQDSGSQTWLFGENDHQMLTIGGNLTINTTTGQSDAEINNYNVLGAFNVNGGAGVAGQQFGSVVAIDNCPVFPGGPSVAGVPVFGSINITGGSVLTGTGVNAGFNVFLGTGVGSGFGPFGPIPTDNTPPVYLAPDFPIMVTGNLSVSIAGTGSVNMYVNDMTVGGSTTLTTSATNNHGVNIVVLGDQAATSFGSLSINALSSAAANNVYLQAQQGTMNVNGALNVNLGAGADSLMMGSANSSVNVTGAFTLTAKPTNSNAVSISALQDTFGALNWTLSGKGTETALFTDTNVTGTATINTSALTGASGTTGVGASPTTTFAINTNAATFNTWGGLSITNGAGADINHITDTNFKGNVTIANGAGATGDPSQFGGSDNIMSAAHDNNLLSIMGSLSITTTTGPSDTEVSDYNVHGNVTLGVGTGAANQTNANVIGLEDNQANSGASPVIGGNVTITGSALASANPNYGLLVALGTNVNVNQNLIAYTQSYPLTIQGNLAITVAGSGSPDINLNDLTVATGSTTITLAAEANALVQVQGTNFVSVFNTFTIKSQATASGGGNDIYSLQDTQGTLEFNGAVKVTVGVTGNILDLAADSGNTSGVPNALLDLFGTSSFTAGAGTNTHFAGTHGTNLFYLTAPTFLHI